ncbi:MAG TPA: hypothetical protein VIT18_08535 [Terrimicrobiaceae bacterium]
MNLKKTLLTGGCALTLCATVYSQTNAATNPAKPEKSSVTKLDGTKLFGIVEVTDDYTIRISNDAGITRLPIAQLGDADFKKYGLNKDRSKDGRLWHERKEAVEGSQKDDQSGKDSQSNGDSAVEIRLGQIAAFQPVIAAYEKTLGSKTSDKAAASKAPDEKSSTSSTPFTPMFSQPGMAGSLTEPFTGFGSSALQPVSGAASGATGVIQSATGAASLPITPP